MNLIKSCRSYSDLICAMKSMGYSEIYIKHVQREIGWISKHQSDGFQTYEDMFHVRSSQSVSEDMKQKYRVIYGIFKRYANEGIVKPDTRTPLFQLCKYNALSQYYKQMLRLYEEDSIAKGLKSGTYRSAISACSGLLLYFQNLGHKNLDTVIETDVLKYFCDSNGELRLSSSTKVNIASVFGANLGEFTDSARRILTYLPKLKKRRKNIPYLTNEETDAIQNVLLNSSDSLNLRDRAIGTLLYYTGLRAGDIAALQFCNIDWKNEVINITQKKTGTPLTLPLTIPVGNAIYDYISKERPASRIPQIFLSETVPFGRIASGTVCNAAGKVYLAAGIRQDQGCRRGTHLFRHHLATSFISSGICRPVISATLGHTDPKSLDSYLYADICSLNKCSISIEKYPVEEEVFSL